MTTAQELIIAAYREVNITPRGRTPLPDELDEALGLLNRYISSLFGTTLGEFLYDYRFPPDPQADSEFDTGTIPPNVRIVAALTSSASLSVIGHVSDGAVIAVTNGGSTPGSLLTLSADGRRFGGVTDVATDPSTLADEVRWLYRADRGDFVALSEPLTLAGESPFPREFDDLLICGLALRLTGRHGVQAPETTVVREADLLTRMRQRYHQTTAARGARPPRNTYQSFAAPFFRGANRRGLR